VEILIVCCVQYQTVAEIAATGEGLESFERVCQGRTRSSAAMCPNVRARIAFSAVKHNQPVSETSHFRIPHLPQRTYTTLSSNPSTRASTLDATSHQCPPSWTTLDCISTFKSPDTTPGSGQITSSARSRCFTTTGSAARHCSCAEQEHPHTPDILRHIWWWALEGSADSSTCQLLSCCHLSSQCPPLLESRRQESGPFANNFCRRVTTTGFNNVRASDVTGVRLSSPQSPCLGSRRQRRE
jgi:hypothetical protein